MSKSERSGDDRIHPAAWGCILYILVAVGRFQEVVPGLASLHLGKVAVALALLGVLLGPSVAGRSPWATPLGRVMVAFTFLAIASVLFSVWKSNSLEFLVGTYLSNLILFFVVVRTATTVRMISLYLGALLVAGAVLAGTAALAAGTGDRVYASTTYDPNDLAMVLVALLPLAVVGVFAVAGIRRLALLVLVGLMLTVILFTGSRGGFLALLAVSLYLLLARFPTAGGRMTRWFSPAKTVLVIVGTGLLLVTIPQSTWERMATMTQVEDDYNITDEMGRVAIWKRGLQAIGERPLGHGLAAFEAVEGSQGGRYKAAHNNWIQVGVELGVAGILLMAAFFLVAFSNLRMLRRLAQTRFRREQPPPPMALLQAGVGVGLKGALIGYLVAAFFLSVAYSALLFALLAVVAATHAHARRQDVPQPDSTGTAPAKGLEPTAPTWAYVPPAARRSGPRPWPHDSDKRRIS